MDPRAGGWIAEREVCTYNGVQGSVKILHVNVYAWEKVDTSVAYTTKLEPEPSQEAQGGEEQGGRGRRWNEDKLKREQIARRMVGGKYMIGIGSSPINHKTAENMEQREQQEHEARREGRHEEQEESDIITI